MTVNLETVIFSVDNPTDLNQYQKALRHLDIMRASGKIGDVAMCIGSWEGELEPSFMVLAKDWDNHIKNNMGPFIEDQECVLRVPGEVHQPCTLEYLKSGAIETVGPMREGKGNQGWTYVLSSKRYFNCG